MAGLDTGDAGRVQAAHLAGTHAHGHAALAEDDGIALHKLGYVPSEHQVFQLLRCGLPGGDHFQVSQRQHMVVGRLQQHARANAFHVHRITPVVPITRAALGQVDLQNAHVDLGFKNFQRLGGKGRGHEHLYKLLRNL